MNSLALRYDHPADLPTNYERAKQALAECDRVDEAQEWANKAAAMAAYARMSKDDSLVILAQRIQARAIRRCGELLKAIPERRGKTDETTRAQTRTAAARAAGLSVHQRITATRVASVPVAEFEEQIERATPATVTELSKTGRTRGRPRKNAARCPACGRVL